ncbi:TIGR03960 family B12-binding radical SAM protein [Irregularibacter muris]|uniref:TIGR03960 family B12-binding radical SAM protein n=1 Tax=Irregularibacter muris TaxID=1796619 RepID=A0AAE3L085_9FIRM|nr:TIGR03960 family B12-binding radical SAM protein [Irregularibacter muris]MCR1899911.1 TIGR03960 family B12-binding radical SAM protein [Irregularibacter muris]
MKSKLMNKILPTVKNPIQYIGKELNSVHKEIKSDTIRYAFAFPDIYEIGMSHLGMKILYHLLNEQEDIYCERVFAPMVDMEEKMRRENIPLFAWETMDAITHFDFIGFTLQYEMSYSNIINMLDLGEVPLLAAERTKEHPFVMVGGPCAYNPEPLADFVDIVILGEAEEVILEVMEAYRKWKKSEGSRKDFLHSIASITGVYIPAFYQVEYDEEGKITSFQPISSAYPSTVQKRIIKDLDKTYYPDKVVVPYTNIVHDRIMLELFRGCTRGCRFCQAGMIYRPVREKTPETLKSIAEKLVKNTGYEDISLASLSTSDYTQLVPLVKNLMEEYKDKGVGLSLPSLRIDSFSIKLAEEIQKVRKTGLTFAPEAGTQKLRNVINKGVTEENLMEATRQAFEAGWGTIKLYFMIGLPTETNEDIEGIGDLGKKVVQQYFQVEKEKRNKALRVTVSTSSFVPKPFTPFQWEPQNTMEELKEKQQYLKNIIRDRKISYSWHEPKISFLEAIFARGDRRLGKVLLKAWEKGCKFDGWDEHFKFNSWMEAFEECHIDPSFYAHRKREYEEKLPWDFIDIGVSKSFLIREHKNALKERVTPFCRENCVNCGVENFDGGWTCYVDC